MTTVVPRRLTGWDIDASGRAVVRQLVDEGAESETQLLVVVNWFEELKAKLANQ